MSRSKQYEVDVTLVIDGDDEADYSVRANVELDVSGGEWGATIDGDVEVYVPKWPGATRQWEWVPMDSLDIDAKCRERAEEALCEACCEDDSSQCVEEAS